MADESDRAPGSGDLAGRREEREVGSDDRLDRPQVVRIGVPTDRRRLEQRQRADRVRVVGRRPVGLRIRGERPREHEPAEPAGRYRARVGDESRPRECAQVRGARELPARAECRRSREPVLGHEAEREVEHRLGLRLAERGHRDVVAVAPSRPVRRGPGDEAARSHEVRPHVQVQRNLVAL